MHLEKKYYFFIYIQSSFLLVIWPCIKCPFSWDLNHIEENKASNNLQMYNDFPNALHICLELIIHFMHFSSHLHNQLWLRIHNNHGTSINPIQYLEMFNRSCFIIVELDDNSLCVFISIFLVLHFNLRSFTTFTSPIVTNTKKQSPNNNLKLGPYSDFLFPVPSIHFASSQKTNVLWHLCNFSWRYAYNLKDTISLLWGAIIQISNMVFIAVKWSCIDIFRSEFFVEFTVVSWQF